MKSETKLKRYSAYGISGLLTVAFLMAGGAKIAGAEMLVANFERWGFPLFLLYVVGTTEVLLAIGLWVPRLSGLAALGLVFTMISALGIHIWFGELSQIGPALLLGVLSAILFGMKFSTVRELSFLNKNLAVENG